jgi:drug/metabolite transporter (DMT)-like permease
MLYLALAVTCSLAIAVIFKISEHRGLDRVALLTVNYAVAFAVAGGLLAGGYGAVGEGLALSPRLLALGVLTGALFIGGFVLFAYAIRVAGISLATGVMRLSVALPFLASWFVWGEVPSAAQIVGLAVAGMAFFLIARRGAPASAAHVVGAATPSGGDEDRLRVAGVLALLFLAGGTVDVAMKTFDETFAATNSRALFLLMVFGVAFAIGLVLVVARGLRSGAWPRGATVAWGVGLGVVNYGSAEFILQAIARLSGPFVFPVNNIALVIGAALVGVFVWGERLSTANKLGLGLAALALVLLGMGRT